MSQCFSFRFRPTEQSKGLSLVIYYEKNISLDTISRKIKKDVTDNLTPKHVYLVTSAPKQYTLADIAKDKAFCGEFLSYVGEIHEDLSFLRSSLAGELLLPGDKPLEASITQSLLHVGMLTLFKRHRGLIVSNNSYHFVKPSGAHCDAFIRASNLLVSSNEVSFLALSLLPYLKTGIKRIYVDTSSIAFLVNIAIQLRDRYLQEEAPSIESFGSYTALNEPYDFVEDSSSLVIISATTSGSLAKQLIRDKRFSSSNVVTLFHLGLPSTQIGLFDVTEAMPSQPISVSEGDCGFCKRESRPVHIAGEQFLPESPRHELLLIRKSDFNSDREKFFKMFAATGTLEWNKATVPSAESTEHFFINARKAIEVSGNALGGDLAKNMKRYITRDLTNIIVLDDQDSDAFLTEVKQFLGVCWEQSITVSKASETKSLQLGSCGSVMVVAAAITSGRQLLSISRTLRDLSPKSSVLYLVAFSKLQSKEAEKQLCNDLQQGGHTFKVLESCFLPRIKEHAMTAWDWEHETLLPFSQLDPLGDLSDELPSKLQEYFDQLCSVSQTNDDLFLPTPVGHKLELRKTFVFWSDLDFDGDRIQNTTQADVYWTIQAVLHDLRNSNEMKCLATPYHTTLLSPANFDRFNDGVIQASLLRAATPIELDYRVDSNYSRQMTDVINSVVENWSNEQGEAALEFLMALWTGRLRINDRHMQEIKEKCSKLEKLPIEMRFILKQLA